MEKRHEVTEIKKYEKLKKNASTTLVMGLIASVLGLIGLGINVSILSNLINDNLVRNKDILYIIAASISIVGGAYFTYNSINNINNYSQKIEELKVKTKVKTKLEN